MYQNLRVDASVNSVRFQRHKDEPDERTMALDLDFDVWMDMGRPSTITVAVEAGDRLNG